MYRLSEVFIELGFCNSKKEFKRLAAAGAVKLNDITIYDDLVLLPTGRLTFGLPLEHDCYAVPPTLHNKHTTDWLIIKHETPPLEV